MKITQGVQPSWPHTLLKIYQCLIADAQEIVGQGADTAADVDDRRIGRQIEGLDPIQGSLKVRHIPTKRLGPLG